MKVKIGLITGIIGDAMKRDFWGTVEKLAEMGYKGIEGGVSMDRIGMPLDEYGQKLRSLGMSHLAVGGVSYYEEPDLPKLIGTAHAVGSRYVVQYYGPCEGREQLLKDCERYNAIGRQLAAEDLLLLYHNHDREFGDFGGQYALDILLENTDPAHLAAELDVAWVQYGGADPVAYLQKWESRCPVVHLKDIADLCERGQFTAIGTGLVDVRGVIETGAQTGVDWFSVEQDRPHNLSGMESVQASMLNLREFGYA